MRKSLLALFGGALMLVQCGPDAMVIQPSLNSAELATPHIHNGDSSTLYISDYVQGENVVLAGLPEGLSSYEHAPGVYKIIGRPVATLGYAVIGDSEGRHNVPVFKGQKRIVPFTVAAFEGQNVKVKGEFNAWNAEASFLKWEDGAWTTSLMLEPGEYAYKLVVDGEEVMDPTNIQQKSNGMGGFNNVLEVPSEGDKAPMDLEFIAHDPKNLLFTPIPEDQEILVFWNDMPLEVKRSPLGTTVEIPEIAKHWGKSWVRVYTARDGKFGADWLIPMNEGVVIENAAELAREDWHRSNMYFAMVDRFQNGDPTNDQPVDDTSIHPRANYQGGDIAGLRNKINDGYFDSLGVNALWISPITQNPEDAWGLWNQGGPVSTFSGYHGYWPISNIKPDHRFATPADVHAFLNDAHAKDYNVLLDYVANHVHQDHPVYQKHPDWATNKYTADGRLNTQLWDEERLTTWFDTFMPTLELRKDTVADWMSDSALVWITEYNFDGFRHDATKHIPMNFTRMLTQKIRNNSSTYVYQIGETYGSDELISSYVGSGKVDAQFNFNLYDAAFEAFTQKEVSFDRLAKALESSLKYYGHHHLMGNISGNQDKPRFASMASGHLSPGEDTKLAGWTREIPPANERGFRKMAAMHAFNIAVPGIPILYYGDEIALHGGNDPDNRKMMTFDNHSPAETALWNKIAELNHLRTNSMPLIYGSTSVAQPMENVLVITRRYLGESVVFFFNNNMHDVHLNRWDVDVPADSYIYQTVSTQTQL